ncbi:hypothetical protein MKW94_007005 [Papaver nudicaule]|uniref:SWIM-type domain-containing protein n=1 Tax=Papaver nudicaule TaxID=74823 RepID=A0AA41VKF3_PAPNU|nr:hypothetical protein [Papaver nudicaule]
MKSPKIEAFSSPNQAESTVSAAKSNIKIPKSEMPDNPLLSGAKSGIKTPKSEVPDNPLLADTKIGIKTPKPEMFDYTPYSDTKSHIKIPKTEDVAKPGFTYTDRKFVLQEFKKCGVILDYVCQGNWMHILYQNRREAQKALSKSGKKINENLIVGLNPVDPYQKQILNDRKPSLSGDRVRKALHKGICLLHRSEGNFFVLGATGNVYTVTLSTAPVCRCNCPDSVVPCKHILFVFFRVLGISQTDHRLCRMRLKTSQLTDLLKMPTKVKVGLPPRINNAVQCAICNVEMDRLHDDEVVKCGFCGDVGHKMCLVTYRNRVRKCKSCRMHWVAAVQNWYTNLAR